MNIKKIIIICFLSFHIPLNAEVPHYLDFKLILNESEAGKKAQNFLKKRLEKWHSKYQKKRKKLSRG